MSLSRLEEASLMIAQALVQKDSMTNMYEIAQKATEIAHEVLVQAAGAEAMAMPSEMDDDMFDVVDDLISTDVAYGIDIDNGAVVDSMQTIGDISISTSDADSSTVTVDTTFDVDDLNITTMDS